MKYICFKDHQCSLKVFETTTLYFGLGCLINDQIAYWIHCKIYGSFSLPKCVHLMVFFCKITLNVWLDQLQ